MKRSRLKNIINKSISNKQEIGNPFDEFKKSLPIEVDDNYRLEAAWKAYGSPKDFKSALWYGLIQPIDKNTYKLPSIGYNEETDEYEYLNKGRENETVAKDIRVWDNDVIPFVQELKQGGFIRVYNEEKDCWTYSKNKPQEIQTESGKVIDSFLKGGKPNKERKYKTYEEFKEYLGDKGGEKDYDLKGAYNDDEVYFDWENEESKNPGKGHFSDKYKLPNHPTFSIYSKYSNSVIPGGTWELDEKGNWSFRTSPWIESQHSLENLRQYFLNNEPGVTLIYKNVPYFTPQAFKQGGQMNVIPDGALHAHKNHMEGAGEDFTAKGVPVVAIDTEEQVAEIEREELLLCKATTEHVEELYKQFNEEEKSEKEKDEIAIKCGKMLVDEILNNTQDNTGLISKIIKDGSKKE